MRATFATIALSLSLAGPTLAQETTPKPQEQTAPITKFDWPVPGSVVIIDTTTKKGRTAKSRYTLKFMRHEDGKSLRIRHEDYEFLEVGGQDAKTPRMQKLVASAEAMASVIPDYRITSAGRYAETIDLEATLERIMPLLAKRMGDSEEQVARMRAQFRRPEFTALMQDTLSKYWNCWVGEWIDWKTPAGKTIEKKASVDAFGVTVPAVLHTTHHGAAPDHPGHIRLSLRAVADGSKTKQAMIAMLAATSEEQDLEEVKKQFGAVTMTRHVEVITHPDTLRPVLARFSLVSTVHMTGEDKPREQIERHEYTFEWPR